MKQLALPALLLVVLIGVAITLFLSREDRVTWKRVSAEISVNGKVDDNASLYKSGDSYLLRATLNGVEDFLSYKEGGYLGSCDNKFRTVGADLQSPKGVACPYLEGESESRIPVQRSGNKIQFTLKSDAVVIAVTG